MCANDRVPVFDEGCKRCHRLSSFLDDVSQQYPDYYARPVPAFGDPDAELLIVGLAPGMGLNAFFTYTVVADMGYSWEVALGAVFLAGILFVIMSVTRIRRWMLDSIPLDLRIAMGAGVGLFVGFIGLKSGGVIVASDATFLTLGDLTPGQWRELTKAEQDALWCSLAK